MGVSLVIKQVNNLEETLVIQTSCVIQKSAVSTFCGHDEPKLMLG
jgi:hypothetical protein